MELMRLALEQAKLSIYIPSAYCVGAVITSPRHEQGLVTGFSREREGNTHAEESAIAKAEERGYDLEGATIYTTMEPCSIRLSCNTSCTDRIIESKFSQVYVGVKEPADFVVCEGTAKLRAAGVKVVYLDGLSDECLQVARGTALG